MVNYTDNYMFLNVAWFVWSKINGYVTEPLPWRGLGSLRVNGMRLVCD